MEYESGWDGSQSKASLRIGVGTNSELKLRRGEVRDGVRICWAHVLIFKKLKVGKKRESLSL